MFREFTFNLEKARHRLSKCEKIKLIEGSMIEGSGIYDFDRSKLLFSTVGTSVNGHLLHQILRDRYHIEMEIQKRDLRDCVLQLKRLMQRYSKQMSRRNRSIILLMRE